MREGVEVGKGAEWSKNREGPCLGLGEQEERHGEEWHAGGASQKPGVIPGLLPPTLNLHITLTTDHWLLWCSATFSPSCILPLSEAALGK